MRKIASAFAIGSDASTSARAPQRSSRASKAVSGLQHMRASTTASDDTWPFKASAIGLEQRSEHIAHNVVLSMELGLLDQGWPTGASLGTELEVRRSLDLGRPTCREAMTILEARGLVDIRSGPRGGLYVSSPKLDDVVSATLMYLTVVGADSSSVHDFRLIVWRLAVETAINRGVTFGDATSRDYGFAVGLAETLENPAMATVIRLAEMLIHACGGHVAPERDAQLAKAVADRDLESAGKRLAQLAGENHLVEPIAALERVQEIPSRSSRKLAMSLAAKMTHDLFQSESIPEAEWETAERFGCSNYAVRQARRILQDFGILSSQRGQKGVLWHADIGPAALIRMLAPCLVSSGMSADHTGEVAHFLVQEAPVLAARRVSEKLIAKPLSYVISSVAAPGLADMLNVENLFLELSGNPLLSIFVRAIGLADACSRPQPPNLFERRTIVDLNKRILSAIGAGDAGAARRLVKEKTRAFEDLWARNRPIPDAD